MRKSLVNWAATDSGSVHAVLDSRLSLNAFLIAPELTYKGGVGLIFSNC